MVKIRSVSIQAAGVGKEDYSIAILHAVQPTTAGRFVRNMNSTALAWPGSYCNQWVQFELSYTDDQGNYCVVAPKSPIHHWYDMWLIINSTKLIYAHLMEYANIDDAINLATPLNNLGGSSGFGAVEVRWSAGVTAIPGRAYGIKFYVTDPGFGDFITWAGIGGLRESDATATIIR